MTSRCATRGDPGVALVAAILALGLVSAIALGMALIAASDPAVAANTAAAVAAGYAADAALEIAAAELQQVPEWSAVLSGAVRSAAMDGPTGILRLPDGRSLDLGRLTNILNCGRASGCSEGQLDAPTAERPWGRNNPRWRVYGATTGDEVWGHDLHRPPVLVVAWVGDDPAEEDGAPMVDGLAADGTPLAGRGMIRVRTESFGPRGAHATRTGTILRLPDGWSVRIACRSSGR